MRSTKINYFVVGLFVLGMIAALIAAVALLTGRTGATDPYFTVYSNVTGVKFGTQVLYEGYPVGQVETVTPTPVETGMRFRVDFAVSEGWRIPVDSVAEVAAPGLLSAITISIRAGASADVLTPGTEIRGRERSDIFAAVSSMASDFGALTEESVRPLLANLNRAASAFASFMENDAQVLAKDLGAVSGEMSVRLPRILTDAEVVAANLIAISEDVQGLTQPENGVPLADRVHGILGRVDAAVGDFGDLSRGLQETKDTTDRLLASLEHTAYNVNTMVTDNRLDIEKAVVDLRYVLDSVSRHVDAINQNLEGASRNMYEFSRQIRNNPGVLIGGAAPADAANQ